jgi:hypothetical protein
MWPNKAANDRIRGPSLAPTVSRWRTVGNAVRSRRLPGCAGQWSSILPATSKHPPPCRRKEGLPCPCALSCEIVGLLRSPSPINRPLRAFNLPIRHLWKTAHQHRHGAQLSRLRTLNAGGFRKGKRGDRTAIDRPGRHDWIREKTPTCQTTKPRKPTSN